MEKWELRHGNSRAQKVILAHRVLKLRGTKRVRKEKKGSEGTRHVRHEV